MTLRLIVDLNEPAEPITPEQAEHAALLVVKAINQSLWLRNEGWSVNTVTVAKEQPLGF